jgi:hypothetical protein
MTVAIIGIPNGFELRVKKLQEYVKSGKLSKYELLTDQSSVILYWRGIAPGETISLTLDGTSFIPGNFKGPSSRIYVYYNDENKKWNEGLSLKIEK